MPCTFAGIGSHLKSAGDPIALPFERQMMSDNKTATEIASLMTLSPWVIGARLGQMWMSSAHPTAGDRREMDRMVSEKLQAVGESFIAMNVAMATAMTSATLALATGSPRAVNDLDAIVSAGLMPFSSRVRANRKRLSR